MFEECEVSMLTLDRIDLIYSSLKRLSLQDCNFLGVNNLLQNRQRFINLRYLTLAETVKLEQINLETKEIKIIDQQFPVIRTNDVFQIITTGTLISLLIQQNASALFMRLKCADLHLTMPFNKADLQNLVLAKNLTLRDYYSKFSVAYFAELVNMMAQTKFANFDKSSIVLHISMLQLDISFGAKVAINDYKAIIAHQLSAYHVDERRNVDLKFAYANAQKNEYVMVFGRADVKSRLKVVLHSNAGSFQMRIL
ncbi:hypothetical protein FGO68_gene9694 [Halteria grandinella]|uniref:Uncharacterized protein n=1 Tax=Halteria grandinella TaxID=5974 RepID=A0A8J8NR93_HALGN|nr:hypothetical protein FGO68_gene9694 [Halteria grandinella]